MIRLLSGVFLAAAAAAAILTLPFVALRLVACLVAALAAHEYQRLAGAPGAAPLLAVVVACWMVSGGGTGAAGAVLVLMAALVVLQVLAANHPVSRATAGAFAALYIGVPLGLLPAFHAQHGARATLLLMATVVVSDTAQYYTGRAWGRRPLAPAISPGKTIEGAAGGVAAATVFLMGAGPRMWPSVPLATLAALGVAAALLGICGDLFESRLKRAAGVKDSSNLIPGHGGVLDRIDALLFVTPAFSLILR